jgi:hypothetical protein
VSANVCSKKKTPLLLSEARLPYDEVLYVCSLIQINTPHSDGDAHG